jgi:hypothetical protein
MRSDMLGNIAVASKRVRQGFWRSEIVSLESRNGPRSRCRDDVFTSRSACWRTDVEGLAFAAGGRRNRQITSARLPTVSPRSLSTKAACSFATSSSAEWMDRCTAADLHHGEDRVRGCHGRITRGKHTGGNVEPQSACAPGYEPDQALAEFDCTILVDDDNKKYLLDSVNAAI